MIKKISLLVLVLSILLVPAVLADGSSAPRPVDGKMIDIEIKALSDEISIGESATLEVTITNLTQQNITPVRMNLGFMWFKIDHSQEMLNIDTDELKLKAYESVTFLITDEVSKYMQWYRVDDEYYIDIEAQINFTVREDEREDNVRDYNYQMAEEVITLKINNLYDGSDYVELEWLDDRDTAYCYEYYADDYYDDGGAEYLDIAKVYYQFNVKNNSSAEILDIAPYSEGIISDYFRYYYEDEEIVDSHIFRFAPIFDIDGQYYCVEQSRTYNVETIEKPDVSVDIVCVESDKEDFVVKYIITAENTGSKTIENYMIYTWEYYEEYGQLDYEKTADIKPGEKISIECYYTNYHDLYDFYAGYLLNGMFFGWRTYVDVERPESGGVIFELEDAYHIGVWDYDYEKLMEELENSAADIEIIEEVSATPNPIPTLIPSSYLTAEPDYLDLSSTPQAEVTIIKRQNPMLWALVAVLLLAIGAAVMIIVAIVKKGKEKGEGEQND